MSQVNPPISATDPLVYSMKTTRWLVENMCKELTPQQLLHRPCPEANSAAWIIGHLTFVDHAMLKELLGPEAPPLPEGYERFAPKSDPTKAIDFGDTSTLLPSFLAMRDRLIAVTEKLDPAALAAPVNKPNPRFSTRWQFLALCGFHTGMHAGQLSTIRRTLGKPALF
jgi:hypothetical protein